MEAARMNHARKNGNKRQTLMFSLITVFLCLNCRRNCLHRPHWLPLRDNTLIAFYVKLWNFKGVWNDSSLAGISTTCYVCFGFCTILTVITFVVTKKLKKEIKSYIKFWYRHWAIDGRAVFVDYVHSSPDGLRTNHLITLPSNITIHIDGFSPTRAKCFGEAVWISLPHWSKITGFTISTLFFVLLEKTKLNYFTKLYIYIWIWECWPFIKALVMLKLCKY